MRAAAERPGPFDFKSDSRSLSPSIDARAKLIALLVLLVAIATTSKFRPWSFAGYFLVLLAAIFLARLPLFTMLARAALVVPFSATFAAIAWWVGEPRAGLLLIVKSFLSVLAALTLAASTPWTRVLEALAFLRVPPPLLLVIQFTGRYLLLVTGEARQMRLAAQCRQGHARGNVVRNFHAAGGAVGVLFARSWERADGIHQAMLARGFAGRFACPSLAPFQPRDAVFLGVSLVAIFFIKLAS